MKFDKFDKEIKVLWKDTKRYMGMPISFTHYAVAEKPGFWSKLYIETGLLSTQIEEVHLYRIDDISVYQSLTQKMFNVGNIEIFCNDASCEKITLKNVKNPYAVRGMINDYVEQARRGRNVRYSEMQF